MKRSESLPFLTLLTAERGVTQEYCPAQKHQSSTATYSVAMLGRFKILSLIVKNRSPKLKRWMVGYECYGWQGDNDN